MREVVHHIHRQADGLRPRRHRRSDIAGTSAQDRNHPAESGGQGIALRKFDPRYVRGLQPAHIVMAVGCIPANARIRGRKQAQFRPRQFSGTHQKHRTGLQIKKYRQESHAILACPTRGVDWNYFLYMSHLAPAKRKLLLLYCAATIEFSPSKSNGQRCIFSTTIKQMTGCVGPSRSWILRSCKPRPMDVSKSLPESPPWIPWTRSRPRASTFSGKPSHG